MCIYIYIWPNFKGLVAALYVYSYKMNKFFFAVYLEHGFGGTCCVLLSSMAEYYVIHI